MGLLDLKSPHTGAASEPAPTPGGMTGVLVVEDEPAIRRLFTLCLRAHGYHVVEACNGADALAIVKQVGHVDLVLTDVVMPVMTGPELVAALRPEHPDLRVIFASGYMLDESTAGSALVLLKPFAQKQLIDTVTRALAGPPAPTAHAA
jgi:two-component system cell cycle sensor histidine kinase/response regulator CckA